LDVPDVGTIELSKLAALSIHDEEVRRRMEEALAFLTPKRFEQLFVGRMPTGKSQESRALVGHEEELVKKGYMTPQKTKVDIVAFTVPKIKKHTQRVILDGRKINHAQEAPPKVRLSSMADVEEAVRQHSVYTELDGKGWFHQFGLHPDIAVYWGLVVGGETYSWDRLPMGWSHSVFIAHTVTETLTSFKAQGVHILVYIDNVYIFGNHVQEVERATDIFLSRCKEVEAVFEVTTKTTQRGKILGMHVDLEEKTIRMPDDFIEKLRAIRKDLTGAFQNERVPTRAIWVLFGNLMWATRVLGEPLYKYARWMAWLSARARLLHSNQNLWDGHVTYGLGR
jgi:hypothetical protein